MKKKESSNKKRKLSKRILGLVLAAVMTLGTAALPQFSVPVRAESAESASEKTITGLGTGAISNPVSPANTTDAWSGSFVYYGKYDGTNPTKYRVLDKASDKFGVTGGSLFLDCDSTLYYAAFDADGNANTSAGATKANEWAYSDVKTGLNGESFLTKTGNFTPAEKSAIAESTVSAHALVKGSEAGQVADKTHDAFVNYTPLTGEQIFLLDAEDASNIAYGYSTTNLSVGNREKTEEKNGGKSSWWLRSPFFYDDRASHVYSNGEVNPNSDVKRSVNVSPAFNVNLSSVIFSSLISSESGIAAGSPGAEYKLTLKDDNLGITPGTVTREGKTITVPYTITGNHADNATQVSLLVMDEKYSAGKAVTSGYTYMKLNVDSWNTSGTGTFILPDEYADKAWGTDYNVYIIAEDVNGEKETDYASAPVEIKAVTASATGYEGTYDGKAHGITVNVTDPAEGATVKYGNTADSCTLETSPAITNVSESPKTVYYEVTADGYLTAKGSVTLTVEPKYVAVSGITAEDKVYSGTTDAELNYTKVTLDGVVNNDSLTVAATGTFEDANAGTNKTVNISNITLQGEKADNYKLAENEQQKTTTATISKASPKVTAPKANTLTYNGKEQELVTAGSTDFGKVLYSLDDTDYSEKIPKAKDAGKYTVYYKVDEQNYWYEPKTLEVTIAKATPSYDKPDDKEITCMQTLKDIELPKGFAFGNVNQELSVGVNEVKLTFTPEDTDNYEVINDIIIKVTTYHTFDKEIAEEKYLKSAATCTDKAVYYKSCECGEKGTDTFEYGEALGHDYADVTYTWSDDGKTCTAKTICTRKECTDDTVGHTVTETVQSTGKETKAATCEEKGITTYTATFENELFKTQTKEVADIDAKGHRYGITTYEWSEDGKTCIATSVCSNDSTHKITETATYEPDKADSQIKATVKEAATTEKMGTTTYTATFKNTEMFKVQTKDVVDIPKVEVTDNPSDTPSDNPTDKPSDNPSKPTDTTNPTDTTKPSDTTKTDGNTSSNDTTKDTSVTPAPKEEGAKLPVSDTKAEYVVNSKAGEEPAVEYKPAADVKEKTVTVPESVTVDGVTYAVNEIADNAFKGNKTVESVVIPKSVKEIGDSAFSGCTNLKSVAIPGSVTEIGENAFSGCTNLKSVKIPESVTEIGDKAFSGCKKLKSVTIGKNVAEIGDSAFANCSALTKATLPANVTKLGSNIFKGCKKLKTITIKATKLTAKNISKNAFKGVGKKVTIKVPKKMKKTYTKLFRKKGLSKKVKIK